MQASHHTIAAHRLIVLAEVNTVSQDWGSLLFKLSLAEAPLSIKVLSQRSNYFPHLVNGCF